MMKSINDIATQGSLEISERYSLKNIPTEAGEQRKRALSQREIQLSKQQQVEVIKQITKQQKRASLFMRNILRHILSKIFKKMLERLVFKKTSYKLLTSKKKRDIEDAFLQIKLHRVRAQHQQLQSLFKKSGQISILVSLVNKKQSENLINSFNQIKYLSIRQNKVALFLTILSERIQQYIKRVLYFDFFNRIRQFEKNQFQLQTKVDMFIKINQIRARNLLQYAFTKIIDTILLQQWESVDQVRKNKHTEFTEQNTGRKQTLTQIREQLKTIKTNIDQEKLNKNKVFQERKKFNNTNKVVMIEAVRKFEKEFKVQQAITKDIQEVFNQKERVISTRTFLMKKSQFSQEVVLSLLSAFEKVQGDNIKKLQEYTPQIFNEIEQFKQSAQYLLKMNCKFQKLIDIYQKRQPYNYQPQYYQLDYENNVIKEMIRCFIKEKSFAKIYKRQKSCTQIEQSQ